MKQAENRAPCYRCGKCPVKPELWGKRVVSIACKDLTTCSEWGNWFLHGGWRGVCAPLRALRRRKE